MAKKSKGGGNMSKSPIGCLALIGLLLLAMVACMVLNPNGESDLGAFLDDLVGRWGVYTSPEAQPALLFEKQPVAASVGAIAKLAQLCPEADGECISTVIASGGILIEGIGEGAQGVAEAQLVYALTPGQVDALQAQVQEQILKNQLLAQKLRKEKRENFLADLEAYGPFIAVGFLFLVFGIVVIIAISKMRRR